MFACAFTMEAQVYEYKVITSVESIVTSGLGGLELFRLAKIATTKISSQKEQMVKAKKMNEISQIVLKFA